MNSRSPWSDSAEIACSRPSTRSAAASTSVVAGRNRLLVVRAASATWALAPATPSKSWAISAADRAIASLDALEAATSRDNDAAVSEHVMRMVSMKAATDNAAGLGRTLKRDFNRARQTKITTELTEIVGGAPALE